MKVEFPVFHVWNYRDTLHTWRKTFLYFMYENMGGYFIHACRISYISCMKIWVCAFVEWIPLLLFFQEKKQHFTLTSNDTNSYNFVLVNHEFHLIRVIGWLGWFRAIALKLQCASESPGWLCERKTSLAILISKKYHSHRWVLASECEWELPKLILQCALDPSTILLRSWGNARSRVNETEQPRCMWKEWGSHLPVHRR